MSLYEEKNFDTLDFFIKFLKEKKTLKDFSQQEFDTIVLLSVWENFISESIVTGKIPSLKGELFQTLYIGSELQNEFIALYQEFLRIRENTRNSGVSEDLKVTEDIVIPKERIDDYLSGVLHILLANNLKFLKGQVRKNKGNSQDDDFESAGLDLAIVAFTRKLKDFDSEKWTDIIQFVWGSVNNCVRTVHSDSGQSEYSPELRKVRDMMVEFREMKNTEFESDPSIPDHSTLTNRQILEVMFGELHKTSGKFLLKHWESYLYVLGIGEVGYEKLIGQKGWEAPKDIEIFRNSLVVYLKGMDEKQRIKYVFEVAFRIDQMGYSVESLDAPVGGDGEECSLGDFIEASEELSVSDRMNIEWFYEIIRKEIHQEEGHKANLGFRDRIILGMLYENAFTIGELYAFLEEYHGGYPVKYIDHWDQFGFYGKPEPGNRNHPHSLDEYWKQFFDDGVDPMKASSIAKILHLTEEGVVGMDVKIKDELNKHYKIVGRDYKVVGDEEEGVIFKFRYYKYKGVHSESHILKEHYVRTKFPNPKE